MTEPLSPRAAAQAACPHLKTYEAIESVSQKLKLYCDDCGKNLTNPETGTLWDELSRLRAEVAEASAMLADVDGDPTSLVILYDQVRIECNRLRAERERSWWQWGLIQPNGDFEPLIDRDGDIARATADASDGRLRVGRQLIGEVQEVAGDE